MNSILVTSYCSPDIDGTSCMIAYSEFLNKKGVNAVSGRFGEPVQEAGWVLDHFNIPYPKRLENVDEFDRIFLVDASDLIGLEGNIPPEKVFEIIDHRKVNEVEKFPNAKVQLEFVGSAATLITEKFTKGNIPISREAAILLSSAILSNTLNFCAKVTTDRDRNAFAWLAPVAQLPEDYVHEMFAAKSDLSGAKLEKDLRGEFAWFDLNGHKFGIAQLEMVGAEELVGKRKGEILSVLESLKIELNLEWTFLSIVELEKAINLFVSRDQGAREILHDLFSVEFKDDVAVRQGLIMRKEIVTLIKERGVL